MGHLSNSVRALCVYVFVCICAYQIILNITSMSTHFLHIPSLWFSRQSERSLESCKSKLPSSILTLISAFTCYDILTNRHHHHHHHQHHFLSSQQTKQWGHLQAKWRKSLSNWHVIAFLNRVMKRHIKLISISIASFIAFSRQEVVSVCQDRSLPVPNMVALLAVVLLLLWFLQFLYSSSH